MAIFNFTVSAYNGIDSASKDVNTFSMAMREFSKAINTNRFGLVAITANYCEGENADVAIWSAENGLSMNTHLIALDIY